MGQRFLKVNQIASRPGNPGRYPISLATWWRWVRLGHAPKPIKLGQNVTVWSIEQLDAWDSKQAEAANA